MSSGVGTWTKVGRESPSARDPLVAIFPPLSTVPLVWGRLTTCAAVDYRRRPVANGAVGRLTIGRTQRVPLTSCPTRSQPVSNTVMLGQGSFAVQQVQDIAIPIREECQGVPVGGLRIS